MSSESASGVDGQRSAEAAEANELVLLPRRPPGGACLRREVGPTLLEAATLAPRGRDTTHLAVLVGRVADPVDAGVVPDSFVRLVDHDHLEPAVAGILAAPVAVEHAETADLPADTLLRNAAEVPGRLHLVHAGVARLAVHDALRHHLLAAPTADPRPEHHVPLLRLVPEHARLFRARRARAAADRRQLPVLPRTQTKQEAHHIRLLLLPQLVQILVRTHICEIP